MGDYLEQSGWRCSDLRRGVDDGIPQHGQQQLVVTVGGATDKSKREKLKFKRINFTG